MDNDYALKLNDMESIREINTNTIDGRLLLAAISKITTESQTDKTPDQVLSQLNKLADHIYKDEPSV